MPSSKVGREVVVDALDLDAEPATLDLAVVLQVGDHLLGEVDEIAKPMPTLPPEGENIAELMPTTSPLRLNVGRRSCRG